MHETFEAPEWFEALTLAERAALLSREDLEAPLCPERRERAERRAERWRRESDLTDDALFAERLALDGLTPEGFLRVLAEPAAELRRRAAGRPGWLEELARAFSHPYPPLPAAVEEAGLGVLELLRPLIAAAHGRVLEGLRRIGAGTPGLLDPETIATALLATLIRRLRWASERTLALELQVGRLEGRLQGETSEDRFRSFVETLRHPGEALELLRRYPVLARESRLHAGQWAETSLEMMERFAADRGEIVRLLAGGADPGPVAEVQAGLSDRHAGGRSVAILAFASGLKIVYKPKPLASDLRFQELVAWLNGRGAEPPLRRLAVLDRGEHGWVEHVAARPCETPEEVERFHERQGAWTALLYALEATDFHHENLIAEGEHPVPIDLETLFQPARAGSGASGPGYLPTAHTVLNSGLLPRRFWDTAAEEAGLDLSGMGASGGQQVTVRRITGEGTDRMRWDLHELRLEAGPNLPTLRGEPLLLCEHREAVLRGFRAMYRLLQEQREALLAPEGPLAPFAGLPIRTLLRGTGVYAHLLHVGHHPDYLRSALDRDRLYDRLWLDAVGYPPFRRTARLERDDLTAGDVPLWNASPGSTDLFHPGGGRIEGFFATSGLEIVRSRLRAMDADDLERQSWLVEASIEATRALDERWTLPVSSLPEAATAGPGRFLATARKIGDRLARLAVEQEEIVTWFHLDLRPGGWYLEPMPADLYNGLSGLALFLAHLGRLTGEERYGRLARLALGTARQRIIAYPASLPHPGAFNGLGGLIYALTHLGLLWGEPERLDEAEELAARMPAPEEDEAFDLIAGSAGAVASLLALYRYRPAPAVLEAAVRYGDRLLDRAVAGGRGGHGWPPFGGAGRTPLTGFSHGAAGIAWALAGLARASGEERFLDAARGALRYERSWFLPERDNWPDLRESHKTGDGELLYAWCHGAPGIGLGRAALLPLLDDPELPGEIRAAVRSTLAEGFGGSQCLCHGDLGNLELVREAGRALGDPELEAEACRIAARVLARIEDGGLRCGTSARTESLGLMVGLAGIGYGLLRAADPEGVPSVLLLETPEPDR